MCLAVEPVCEAYWKTPIVFSGEVLSIEPFDNPAGKIYSPHRRVRFRVDRSWRGEAAAEAIVTTASSSGECGFEFQVGTQYLVFAHARDGKWITSICSATTPLAKATDAVKYLEQVSNPPFAGRIFGTATISVERRPRPPAPGFTVTLSDSSRSWTATTQSDGSFEFRDMPAGKYRIAVEVRAPMEARLQQPWVELVDRRACARADIDINVPVQLEVRGSVVRPNSRAASSVDVVVYISDRPGTGEVVASMTSNHRGEFSFKLTAGHRYIVVATTATERGIGGPFELTPATAPMRIVLRK